MTAMNRRVTHYLLLAAFLLGLPWLCAWLAGKPEILEGVKTFPPRTEDWGELPGKLWNMRAPFSWPVFIVMVAGVLAVCFPFVRRLTCPPAWTERSPGTDRPGKFPWYGWLGVAALAASWILAWNRFDWFGWGQRHTYVMIWFSFILLLNALCEKRRGWSLMTRYPWPYAASFPVSALFWWFFEYLNRFVWNWYYLGVQDMSAAEYTFFATFSFSTVLPAVSAIAALLKSFPAFSDNRLTRMAAFRLDRPLNLAAVFLAACAGLTGIVFFPQYTFPLLWISPLCLFVVVQAVLRERSVVADRLAAGDWGLVVRFAAASLICGFCWETWNWLSFAKWVYAVPYVHAFQIWEMPVAGFAGYLPFGVEIAVVLAWMHPGLVEEPDAGAE